MYAMNTAYDKYKQQGVMTANPIELIVMLYDGAIKQMKIAKMSIEENNEFKINSSLQKAQDIIMELVNCLDLNYPIADELLGLYEFMINEILHVYGDKDITKIDGVVEILTQLRQTWNEISREGRGAVTLIEE